VLEVGRQVRPRRRARVGADRLCPGGRAGRDAGVPQGVAGEHELPGTREQQREEREQRHELGRGLPTLAGEPVQPDGETAPAETSGRRWRRARLRRGFGWRDRGAHAASMRPGPVTGLRAFVTKVRQYDEYARQTL
jgi:hypothetical protein